MVDSRDIEDGHVHIDISIGEDDIIDDRKLENQHLLKQDLMKNFKFLARPFVEPSDINWRYLRNKQTKLAFIRIWIWIGSVFLLIFMTSPAEFIRLLSFNSIAANILSFNFAKDSNVTVKFIFKTALPALLVMGINALLQLFISILSRLLRS